MAAALWLKTILCVLDTISSYSGFAYAHLTCITHMLLHGLCTSCRTLREKQQKCTDDYFAKIRQVFTPREVEYLPASLPDCQRRTNKTWATGGEHTPELDLRVWRAGYKMYISFIILHEVRFSKAVCIIMENTKWCIQVCNRSPIYIITSIKRFKSYCLMQMKSRPVLTTTTLVVNSEYQWTCDKLTQKIRLLLSTVNVSVVSGHCSALTLAIS